ncbi:phosphate/phosphite/phosphonate ABC transporter substrate-binding protein [Gallionella capsiferriformans]|jgi:phosphonate transport system substrate-binding protein|uniref:Phosphonate ABC transporter, periplasmic phosphonate-binding protein n=1 Tax=Gallionella capsiferriformans (strain ES-2) TaxID=395494 RepID=D9SFN8_GALCS|nr:PhnD/SsuA/transferrin family substrate-binding protein [Gallionella capsiferriformans]ADL55335.1 phosphonate ABC transporter, periplasmic phosphonate-binding protein [Gallionella capsiferriformans ES-2]
MLCLLMLLAGCGPSEHSNYQPELGAPPLQPLTEYVVGIHPLHNPQRLMELYGPIVDYLNSSIPEAHFKLEASRNYEEFEKKLYAGQFAFAMPNPYQTIKSVEHGYRIFGKMGDDADFRGIILIRRDSGIKVVKDLKGRAIAYPAATALAATLMPQYYLHTHGINVNHDIENRYVGSQESSIMNVLRGDVAAGATWPVPWRAFIAEHPDLAMQLESKWETGSLPNNGWVVRTDLPKSLADNFAQVLFTLHQSEQGRTMLAKLPISNFEPASDETYRPVREFLKKFSSTVRQVE